jgi:hypothetical protein
MMELSFDDLRLEETVLIVPAIILRLHNPDKSGLTIAYKPPMMEAHTFRTPRPWRGEAADKRSR